MKPLDHLKKGLAILYSQIQERKVKLTAKLKSGRSISEADEEWLDGKDNLVDEERVVRAFENVSDYEQYIKQLSTEDKVIVQRLQDLAQVCGSDVAQAVLVKTSIPFAQKLVKKPVKKENATLA
ncbi:hypothetical protein J3R82DRAFT_2024 [Butyriboletus roseoflavus]|nr:hypothetical protein J3R82DRAFT_2024 [Butyriboletus roseoflavus]